MKSSLTAEQLELLSTTLGDDLAKAISSADPVTFRGRVPSTWIDLVAEPGEQAIRAIWASAENQLTRFVDYLARSIDGAAIAEVHGFPVLVMALPDWREEDFDLAPGFCWMGTPTDAASIERLVAEIGPIPPSLDSLWRVANFITLKERSILCSLDPGTRAMTEAPVVLPALADPSVPEDVYECLQIAVVNDQMVTCMTRRPGQTRWDDYLVRRFRRTDQLTSAVRIHLDDKLADWTFNDWSPPAAPSG